MSTTDHAAVYRRITKAFSEGDGATVMDLLADDVVWHTDDNQVDVPSEFRGKEAFRAAAGTPKTYESWEVVPHVVVAQGNTVFSHQIDTWTFADGSQKVVHLLLHLEFNEKGQIKEAWEFGQSAIPH